MLRDLGRRGYNLVDCGHSLQVEFDRSGVVGPGLLQRWSRLSGRLGLRARLGAHAQEDGGLFYNNIEVRRAQVFDRDQLLPCPFENDGVYAGNGESRLTLLQYLLYEYEICRHA